MDAGLPPSPGGRAWVISALMGFGHLRAAHSLRDIACGDVLVASEKDRCSPREYLLWQRFRKLYYFMSRGESIPVVGRLLFKALHELQKIPTFYPARDLSRPDLSTRYVANLVRHRDLCRLLLETVGTRPLPVVHTFFATALSFDLKLPEKKDNYLLICDSDFHRVWVPEDPQRSSLRYLAPGTRVKRRLMAYGVPEERIFLTGFPLPRENIGSRGSLEVLRADLFDRLLRLDPQRNFFAIHGRTVEYFLQRTPPPAHAAEPFTVMFAVGGSGVHTSLAEKVLKGLRRQLREGSVNIILAAGTSESAAAEFMKYVDGAGLAARLDRNVRVVYSPSFTEYFRQFNRALRVTDVLWTKPSELSFYCALGLPLVTAPAVGYHEELNRRWLQDMHAGIRPAGRAEDAGEWLLDLRDSGMLAEAAWEGFLKGRKMGAYKIEELLAKGSFTTAPSPLER